MASGDMMVPTGRLLAAGRRAAGLTQAQLSDAAGVNPATLSRWEQSGNRLISGKTANIKAVLDVLLDHGVELGDDLIRLVKPKRR